VIGPQGLTEGIGEIYVCDVDSSPILFIHHQGVYLNIGNAPAVLYNGQILHLRCSPRHRLIERFFRNKENEIPTQLRYFIRHHGLAICQEKMERKGENALFFLIPETVNCIFHRLEMSKRRSC